MQISAVVFAGCLFQSLLTVAHSGSQPGVAPVGLLNPSKIWRLLVPDRGRFMGWQRVTHTHTQNEQGIIERRGREELTILRFQLNFVIYFLLVTLQVLYKLKTSKVFEKSRSKDDRPNTDIVDEDPYAIQIISWCPESRMLCIAGVSAHVILYRFSKQEVVTEVIPVITS